MKSRTLVALLALMSSTMGAACMLDDIDWDANFKETRPPIAFHYRDVIHEEVSMVYMETVSLFLVCVIVYNFAQGAEVCPMIAFNCDL